MAKFSLRRYDTQARVSVIVSLASVVSLIAMVVMLIRNFVWSELVIFYGNPVYKMIVYGAAFATLVMSAFGFGFGFNSAGQRRNDKPRLSWIGFFIGAVAMCLTIVLLFLFRSRSEFVR